MSLNYFFFYYFCDNEFAVFSYFRRLGCDKLPLYVSAKIILFFLVQNYDWILIIVLIYKRSGPVTADNWAKYNFWDYRAIFFFVPVTIFFVPFFFLLISNVILTYLSSIICTDQKFARGEGGKFMSTVFRFKKILIYY